MSDVGPLPPDGVRTRGADPTGTRLLLIRHGEAVCNVSGVIGGPKGCAGLTARGREQAGALRDRLAASGELAEAAVGYVSALPRAQETAAFLAPAVPALASPTIEAFLNELEPGEADGLTWPDFVKSYGVPDWARDPDAPLSPGGESLVAFATRCERAFQTLADRHPGELVVVVCHGGVVEQLLRVVLGVDSRERLRLRTEHCSMAEVEIRDDRWRLLRYNDRAPVTSVG